MRLRLSQLHGGSWHHPQRGLTHPTRIYIVSPTTLERYPRRHRIVYGSKMSTQAIGSLSSCTASFPDMEIRRMPKRKHHHRKPFGWHLYSTSRTYGESTVLVLCEPSICQISFSTFTSSIRISGEITGKSRRGLCLWE